MTGRFPPRVVAQLGTLFALANSFFYASAQAAEPDGRELFLNPRKGNCIACHQVLGDVSLAGKSRIGPELAGIKQRYVDRVLLRAAIWDLSEKNPDTIMPPYGKYRILTETEIDAVMRYLETL